MPLVLCRSWFKVFILKRFQNEGDRLASADARASGQALGTNSAVSLKIDLGAIGVEQFQGIAKTHAAEIGHDAGLQGG